MRNDVLVAEISGKRPGDAKKRPTERFKLSYDKVIISNNSDGYVTDWDIVTVPDDYRNWYIKNVKSSENAWYAPMNRSYAIKYAREHGYKYLVQLDDNIKLLDIATLTHLGEYMQKTMKASSSTEMMDDFIEMLVTVLENTNAVMSGFNLAGVSTPENTFLAERFVYSFFALKLDLCPDIFQGDFEDDIEYRLKCKQMGLPVVQVCPFRYGKTSQGKTKDLTGCRAEYVKAGLKRGEHMRKLYGETYDCAMRDIPNGIRGKVKDKSAYFKHHLKPFKLGVLVYDMEAIENCAIEIFKKWCRPKEDKAVIKEKQPKKTANKKKSEAV